MGKMQNTARRARIVNVRSVDLWNAVGLYSLSPPKPFLAFVFSVKAHCGLILSARCPSVAIASFRSHLLRWRGQMKWSRLRKALGRVAGRESNPHFSQNQGEVGHPKMNLVGGGGDDVGLSLSYTRVWGREHRIPPFAKIAKDGPPGGASAHETLKP
jgi:hypothetical protein